RRAAPALGTPGLRRSTSGRKNRHWSRRGARPGPVERDFTAARDREGPGACEDSSRRPTECWYLGDLCPADVVDPGPIRGELGAGLGTRARSQTYRFAACNLLQPDVQLAAAAAIRRVSQQFAVGRERRVFRDACFERDLLQPARSRRPLSQEQVTGARDDRN